MLYIYDKSEAFYRDNRCCKCDSLATSVILSVNCGPPPLVFPGEADTLKYWDYRESKAPRILNCKVHTFWCYRCESCKDKLIAEGHIW